MTTKTSRKLALHVPELVDEIPDDVLAERDAEERARFEVQRDAATPHGDDDEVSVRAPRVFRLRTRNTGSRA